MAMIVANTAKSNDAKVDEILHVLVVDDEPGIVSGIKRVLQPFTVDLPDVADRVHFTVDTAATGKEAIAKIDARAPHILLLDHKLPDLSGLDLLVQVAQKAPEILTIMVTAFASLEMAVEAIKRGAYNFLAKPFTPAELKNVVRKAAGRIVFERQARKFAQERTKVRFEFISVLAHELKSPLAATEGYLRIIKDRSAGQNQADYDRMIDRSLIRLDSMRKLVNDLLDLTQIESGQKKRQIVELDVADVAKTCMETFVAEGAMRDIVLSLQSNGGTGMPADRGEIEIILNNLLSNAIKYNRQGGRVELSVRGGEDEITIAVSDTGIGMTSDDAAKLFSEFTRIRNAKTRDILGSGLGLSIVKKLAKLYHGHATVESKPDVGSTFTVTLKRHGAETANG
jgi:signal transduction histidine kinase